MVMAPALDSVGDSLKRTAGLGTLISDSATISIGIVQFDRLTNKLSAQSPKRRTMVSVVPGPMGKPVSGLAAPSGEKFVGWMVWK